VSDTASAKPIEGVEWTLVELDGAPAGVGAGEKPATLRLVADGHAANGFAGCNRLASTYTLSGDSLQFAPIITTKMACSSGMDLERRYVDALQGVRSHRLAGDTLVLLDATAPRLRLVAR
jgi:putative lipoprotein